jgi:hypothetical protein
MIKEPKKFSLAFYDPAKPLGAHLAYKFIAALIGCNMECLLSESVTIVHNKKHSKELMVELYKKLQGSALNLFSSINAQCFYLGGGRGVQVIKALADKFNPLDAGGVQLRKSEPTTHMGWTRHV